ncbi:hypothetical protein [Streptomyces sp. HUAS TT20]|uniref:hypothetical protein n=1 Tax=Streptomyces sp. HUAS TT20 TaxID=3447509 RepID=UPI0021DA6B33|nr:hypothetical protein [Streptomyces sp. HUAS 15-9]UXY32181.1 hypothetical protein N8I87_40400 [Streptomyces sp. HUAS 15-9]
MPTWEYAHLSYWYSVTADERGGRPRPVSSGSKRTFTFAVLVTAAGFELFDMADGDLALFNTLGAEGWLLGEAPNSIPPSMGEAVERQMLDRMRSAGVEITEHTYAVTAHSGGYRFLRRQTS